MRWRDIWFKNYKSRAHVETFQDAQKIYPDG